MAPGQVRPGIRVRVMEHHRVDQRRDLLVGTVVAHYGGGDYMAVDVRLDGGQYRPFWPSDLEEISSPQGLVALAARLGTRGLTRALIHPSAWKGNSRKVDFRFTAF